MKNYVDIFIPTKDRAMQLHLLFDGINNHLNSIGKITVSFQASNDEYKNAYKLLEKRLHHDEHFKNIRNNSQSIIFKERDSIEKVYNHFQDSGDSDFILQLLDDEVIVGKYDLFAENASQEFFKNENIVSCSLRLGDNISEQNSWSKDDGVVNEIPEGHISALFSYGKPNYVVPSISHEISHEISQNYGNEDFIKWLWPLNMNASHWNQICCLTGHIYRRKFLLNLYEKFGKSFFMDIEGQGSKMLQRDLFKNIKYLLPILDILDFFQMKLLKWIAGIYEQPVLLITFYKIFFHTRLRNKEIPTYMISPIKSVSVNCEMGSSFFRGHNLDQTHELNSLYLDKKVMCINDIESIKFFFPWTILKERKFIDYSAD